MKNKKTKLFITFEGGEATGKTTQIKKLNKLLLKKNIPHIITREPGGTKTAENLRKIILSKKNNIDVSLEVLLLMASRKDHINKVIIPALNKGKIVICDRYVDSTAIYQGYYKKFGIKKVYDLHKTFLDNLMPDITFFFNMNVNLIHKRLNKRKTKNKFDIINTKFNTTIRNGYLKIMKKNKRFRNINASLSINNIHDIIIKEIQKKYYGI